MSAADGRSASGSVAAYHDPDDRYINENALTPVLEDEDEPDVYLMLMEWWRQVRENQAHNRMEQAIDRDFYDGLQLTDEERNELIERGQAPIVRNYIKSSIDWIIGTEKRTRFDFNVYPRKGDDEANDRALIKTKLLKYNSDVNKAAYARSRAFEDAITAGIGWLEDGIRNDDTDELQYSRHESWRNVWYDHLSVEPSMSDARFIFRERWVDLDIAIRMYPHKKSELRASSVSHSMVGGTDEDEFYSLSQVYMQYDSQGYAVTRSHVGEASGTADNRRERVKLVECEYRMPRAVKRMRGYDSPFNQLEFEQENEKHASAVNEEIVSVYDALEMSMHYAVFCEAGLLNNGLSPYRHNDFRFTPIWAYRRGRDNAPYGPIRNMRDAQRDLNARSSKALFILAVNQIVAEIDAVEDWEETIEQAADPQGVIRLRKNAGKDQVRFELINDKQLAEEHLMLMDKNVDFLQRSSGVTDENLGQSTNAISGKAIEKKQTEGAVVTFGLFDNLHHAIQLQGEKQLSLIEQFYDAQKSFRVIGDAGKAEYEDINLPEYDPISGQVVIKNDMTSEQSDFVINTADFRQTVREAQAEALLEKISQMPPEMAIQLLDLAVDQMDVPNKEEWLKRIRQMNGHTDPDEKETPEEMQARAEREAQEAADKQLQDDAIAAKTDRDKAAAERDRANVTEVQSQAVKNNLTAMKDATDAAVLMVSMPALAPITDQLLESAGFVEQVDLATLDLPREKPVVDPEAQEQAQAHESPPVEMDPNQQYATDSRERIEHSKLKNQPTKPKTGT